MPYIYTSSIRCEHVFCYGLLFVSVRLSIFNLFLAHEMVFSVPNIVSLTGIRGVEAEVTENKKKADRRLLSEDNLTYVTFIEH